MGRYWVSWYQPGDDWRPLAYPPTAHVLGAWASGSYDGGTTVCALVEGAQNEDEAKAAIAIDWPESATAEWRFVTPVEVTWLPPNDRFPLPEWSRQRLGH